MSNTQEDATMHPCHWTMDDMPEGAPFAGWTDGSTWNGWANVEVRPEVRDVLAAWADDLYPETAEDLRSLPLNERARVSLNGYCVGLTDDEDTCPQCGHSLDSNHDYRGMDECFVCSCLRLATPCNIHAHS